MLFITLVYVKSQQRKLQPRTELELGAGPARFVRLTDAQFRVLEAMANLGQPATITELAAKMSVHPNTVRQQLKLLLESGHVAKESKRDGQYGRPAATFRPTVSLDFVISEDEELDPLTEEYLSLTGAFADYLVRTNAAPTKEALVIGRMWGRSLAKMQKMSRSASPRAQLTALFDRMGFTPQKSKTDENLILLRTCPLITQARRKPEVICQLHQGVAEGALESLGHSTNGVQVIPWATQGACHLLLDSAKQNK